MGSIQLYLKVSNWGYFRNCNGRAEETLIVLCLSCGVNAHSMNCGDIEWMHTIDN